MPALPREVCIEERRVLFGGGQEWMLGSICSTYKAQPRVVAPPEDI